MVGSSLLEEFALSLALFQRMYSPTLPEVAVLVQKLESGMIWSCHTGSKMK